MRKRGQVFTKEDNSDNGMTVISKKFKSTTGQGGGLVEAERELPKQKEQNRREEEREQESY